MPTPQYAEASDATFDRYLAITNWAARRYQDADGRLLITMTGSTPSRYTRIEDAAAVKYLGCKRRWPRVGFH